MWLCGYSELCTSRPVGQRLLMSRPDIVCIECIVFIVYNGCAVSTVCTVCTVCSNSMSCRSGVLVCTVCTICTICIVCDVCTVCTVCRVCAALRVHNSCGISYHKITTSHQKHESREILKIMDIEVWNGLESKIAKKYNR